MKCIFSVGPNFQEPLSLTFLGCHQKCGGDMPPPPISPRQWRPWSQVLPMWPCTQILLTLSAVFICETLVTGATADVAERVLEACSGNLEMAIGMHMDSDGTGLVSDGASNGAPPASSTTT